MKLYYAPGSCSIGTHVILEEIGKPYQSHEVNLAGGEQFSEAFKQINPKSKVPVMILDDGTSLTEWIAIAGYLAVTNPEANLLPQDPLDWARATEYMVHCNCTMHSHGFARIRRAERFTPSGDEDDEETVRGQGRRIFNDGFALMDEVLQGREWLLNHYSIADAALFYVSFWADVRGAATMPPNVAAHYARMKSRPAVQRALAIEGFA
ncbi:glutathione S-transferase family protein [Acidiphilium acidophilum]|uniref:Glutathione S-transferase N-terminal domain-containing protein n=1 Tax=Acidiphilium acidophilum TaxID=76588 RepID=A0AAW9DQH3_ACIAO|nr:glutathione S-transferase N-terminal domain-containing protein [Acidiphilium acidophilum]MDX5930902.1 glutathione S-transferase N-terminal domain-containing protein [Acidiphilium acidophilum]MEE3501629.1 glutathione S-transferase N-terminal domain-containing protein [Acidiphilium acidophilum]